MTSEITFYQTKITPKMNAKVDNILAYLGTTRHTEPKTFQYQKHALDLTVKLTMEQRYAFGADGYNYAKIKNSDDNKEILYFIMDSTWTSQNCVSLILSMDTVNSFNDVLDFSPNTHITRQHKDRFVYDVPTTRYTTLVRKVDKEAEGINPAKFYDKNKVKIYDEDLEFFGTNQKKSNWYLIYRANADLTTTSQNANNPVELLVTSSYPFLINGLSNLSRPIDYPAYIILQKYNSPETKIFADGLELPAFGSNIHTSTTIVRGWIWYRNGQIKYLYENADGQYVLQSDTWTTATNLTTTTGFNYGKAVRVDDVTDVMYYGDNELTNFVGDRLQTIDTINRTESRYMKIIELPYPPIEFTFTGDKINVPDGWSLKDGMLYTSNVEKNFYRLVGTQPLDIMKLSIDMQSITIHDTPNIHYESKLYNSEFYDYNIVYDSFEKQYLLERFMATKVEDCEYQIMFKPTNTINSNFLFEFYDLYEVYQELGIRSQYMNVQRNNELPMYNSDYLNYIRNGYNYDRKNIARQTVSAGVSFTAGTTAGVISKVGSTGGFGVATAVSLISSAITTLTNNISAIEQAEQTIEQKILQAKTSPASVNGADDIDLLNYTTGNKLEVYTNSCTNNMKNAVWNLFRFTGYACNEYDVPNVNTRYWYNFIQCEPVFIDEEMYDLPAKVIDDIKARYSAGVTVYHDHNNQYDFEQLYENYETWLIRE